MRQGAAYVTRANKRLDTIYYPDPARDPPAHVRRAVSAA